MKKNLYIILVIMAAIFASCNKFLDVKPAGSLIPGEGDVVAFDRLLNNTNTIDFVYINNNNGSYLAYLTDNVEVSDNQALYGFQNGNANIDSYLAYTYKLPYSNPHFLCYFWDWGFYRQAQQFNVVIDGVKDVVTPETENHANEVIAQATVARAWSYFTLAVGFGPVYRPGGDNSRKIAPYRTSSNVVGPMEPLSTVQEIFDRVLADIHSVLPHIPKQTSANTRFGRVQTYTFLAEYHLFARNFDSVAHYANLALELASLNAGGMENLFLDMNLFTWANANVATNPDLRNASGINTTQGAITETWHRENLLLRGRANVGFQFAYPSTDFLSLFDPDTDLRREFYFFEFNGFSSTVSGVTHNDGRRIQNYQGKIRGTTGYTYPELLLMRAEGRARTGDLSGALKDLNDLRKFRHRTGTPDLVISGQDNIIQEIVNERRRELQITSHKRFFDLKRFVLDAGKPWSKTTITRTVRGQTYTGTVDSEHFIIPMKNTIIMYNPQWGVPLDNRPWTNSPH
jgi:hypothetical protein